MSDIVQRAKDALDPDARMDAYYYGFDRTGVGAVDRILSQVADAGKAYHNTDSWSDRYEDDDPWKRGGRTESHVERMQEAANEAAALVQELVAEVERLRRQHQGQADHIVALRTELDRLTAVGNQQTTYTEGGEPPASLGQKGNHQ